MKSTLKIYEEKTSKEQFSRESKFSYQCNRCNLCCQNQRIRVNPYETARLASLKKISTTEFLSSYTTQNGTELDRDKDGYCVFLTDEGCGVHTDRPLVCRIYPLGRHLSWLFEEYFTHLTPHPNTEGAYGEEETIGAYLENQDAEVFIDALDRYIRFIQKLALALNDKHNVGENSEILNEWRQMAVTGSPALQLIDMDIAVQDYCHITGTPFPAEVEEKFELHLKYLQGLTETLSLSE